MGLMDRLNPGNFGIFSDSEALGAFDEVEVVQAADYYGKSRTCEICGNRRECQMSWGELYCLQYGILPNRIGQMINRPDLFPMRWVYNPKFSCFHVDFRCTCNPSAIMIFDMTPTEAERVLTQAGRNGVISDQQKAIIGAIQPAIAHLQNPRPQGPPPMRRG